MKPRIIAFYLPQFHPTPDNDRWWGKGFTEWTNVGKAKPLFKGHYQPRVPADLGYYDLRIADVREQQAQLAREAGIEGFCYWHYWFEQNHQLMEDVFDEVLETGKPDFPFCLGWANHSWYAKTWNKDVPDKLLCEQRYLGKKDYEAHFQYTLKAFKDKRYINVNGQPLFFIFDAESLPDDFIPYWNKLAEDNDIEKIFFVGRYKNESEIEKLIHKGFSALTTDRMQSVYSHYPRWLRFFYRAFRLFVPGPDFVFDYEKSTKYLVDEIDRIEFMIPQIVPQWDHSPRSGGSWVILNNSTPGKFAKHVKDVLDIVKDKKNKIIFLKSWNEWAEGNYMEPDLRFGKGYIKALYKTINEE